MSTPPLDPCAPATSPDQCHIIRDIGALAARLKDPALCHVLCDQPSEPGGTAVIELRVCNHPGVMSHVTGLFARRAFNLEAIVCAPNRDDGGASSRMFLLVAADARLEQVERQLAKLHDVIDVRHRSDLDRECFVRAADLVPSRDARAVPR